MPGKTAQYFGTLPRVTAGYGWQTLFGTHLPPGGRLACYLRSTGEQSGDDRSIAERLVTTLSDALKQVRAGAGDTIVVLPGHSESVTDATMLTNLVAGTRIIGCGVPGQSTCPTFNWTVTGASWAIDDANVVISGLNLNLDGANGVVKAINVTGSGVQLVGNNIRVANGAALKATIGIEVGSGATLCRIAGNYIYGSVGDEVTDCIKVVGGTVPSNLEVDSNHILASANVSNGLINVTVAAVNCRIHHNVLYNTEPSSEHCITIGNVAASGVIHDNYLGTNEGGATAPAATGFSLGAAQTFRIFENYALGVDDASGDIAPARDT